MLICGNAAGVHGQRKVGHPWSSANQSRNTKKTLSLNARV